MIGTLTVEEQLTYSAELRYPTDVSRDFKKEMVEKTMEDLGIIHRRHNAIGSSEKRGAFLLLSNSLTILGLSGGEKRRTQIGTEMVINPQVLFLDVPTSGLDSARALSLMTLLKTMATENKQTIVVSLDQPRSNVFQLFDRVILLSRGKVVFSGPRSDIVPFFARNGFKCPKGFNHSDYLSSSSVITFLSYSFPPLQLTL